MPLAGYQPETTVVPIGKKKDQSIEVHGLSFQDLSVLIREHMPDLETVVDLFDAKEKFNIDAAQPVIVAALSQFPGLCANIIALAAGEGSAEDAMRIPGPTQVKCLNAIFALTFSEVGGLGKAWETIAGLLSANKDKARQVVTQMQKNRR